MYIALGGNLGDRLGTIEKALEILGTSGVNVQEVSGLYESEPMYLEEQPQFLNAVCKVLSALDLTNGRGGQVLHRSSY